MCGFAGIFLPEREPSSELLRKMGNAIAHRGPDAEGVFTEGSCGLVHRRLSIIDLSEAANQPMVSACGQYVMLYNGEVYNFNEIRQQLLKEKPLHFRTRSDSEVVLEAFAHWGKDCVKRFNGMFAVAVYDRLNQSLHFFRDRIGIKPLFIFRSKGILAFASEIKALKAIDNIGSELTENRQALADYLHLGYIPGPGTRWNEISKFPPAHYAVYDGKELKRERYWNAEDFIGKDRLHDEQQALEKLRDLLFSSVEMRLVSDVPFGTFLSGGVDSSLVTAIASKVHTQRLNTFSIGFDSSKHDESSFARSVADHLGTIHHEFRVTEHEAQAIIPDLPYIYDEPFADSSAIPTLLVSKLARSRVTMSLSGDGGDELFMGYGSYRWAKRLDSCFWKLHRLPAAALMKGMGSRYRRIADLLLHERKNLEAHIFSQEQYLFPAHEIRKILAGAQDYQGFSYKPPILSALSPEEKQSFFDLTHYLRDDLLVKVDRATMHHSLEGRVPLLDYRIVEFALGLQPDLKMRTHGPLHLREKYLLKKLLFSLLPEPLFARPKWGFSVPMSQWLKGPLRSWMLDTLSEEQLRRQNLLDPESVQKLIKNYLSGHADHLCQRIWTLLMLNNNSQQSAVSSEQ